MSTFAAASVQDDRRAIESNPAFRLSGVGHTHASGQAALSGIDIQAAQGERIAIIGPSGAGKTTLLRLLATGLKPDSGQLSLLGEQPWGEGSYRLRKLRARIGLVHQAPPLPPRQRVVTAVLAGRLGHWSLPRSLLSLIYPLDRSGAAEALARLDLADKLYVRCDQLSGGQLQRVGIARMLYQQPELILADEPVSAMDPVLSDHTLGLLNQEAQRRNATLVASLHAVDLALAHFPRIIGLRAGQILFDKPAEALRPEELTALYANEQLEQRPAEPVASQVPNLPRC
ncbi:phosphonate ABC transporter ATP-binding protein [Stutzerimonas nitrititolerans]|uniref:phosphonate ABC transporter ATP-binding protein n=1 Tax=Stutzerimonas nitrititolerans TaxID=2482751 RepID=UPI00026D675F|nr:phosphonate ABC transporter ATP-binding protein [Stutzerimonas nitrititolerans]AFN77073.1 ABC transporter ATP-binding protein [Stutzerimonas stutzeri DSM 10701]MBA1235276.1 phosphonate ABC transporter ATP-binding protein [Stutzerimonas stutzeri]NNT96071.1 phosphonate ABC transporter ATP-binding protein [Stutzerimonas nitrititolerans]WAD28101.1 phosphonate ABC transporter ATP-binding protein [Pseudomonadaceae bacterium T75]